MKAKKVTAGEKLVDSAKWAWTDGEAAKQAEAIDRLIARERRKERERIASGLQTKMDNTHPNEHVNTRSLFAEVITDIRNGGR